MDGLYYAWVPKALVYVLGQLAIGVVVVRRLGRVALSSEAGGRLQAALAGTALAVAGLLIAALILRVWVQSAAAFGGADAWLPENLRTIALESRWGSGWRLQAWAALGMLLSALAMRARSHGWAAYEACAIGLAVVMPLLGHAAGSPARHALHVLHNLSAAAWLGTLAALTLSAWRWRTAEGSTALERLVDRFSPLALTAAAAVAASGAWAAWLYVGSWESMWTTTYGRVLSAKLATVGVVAACGWMNWRRVRGGRAPGLPVMTAESIAALVVLCLTGVLTETEHP